MWLHTYLSEIHIRGLGRHRGVRLGHNLLGRGRLQHAQVCKGAPGVWRHLQRCRLLRWDHRLRPDDLRRSAYSKFMDLHHICYVIRNGSWRQGRMSGRQWRPLGHQGHWCGHWLLAHWDCQLRMWVTCEIDQNAFTMYLQMDVLCQTSTVSTSNFPTTWSGWRISLDWLWNDSSGLLPPAVIDKFQIVENKDCSF